MYTRTITLSNRQPVKIDEDNWPVIADAKDYVHDGQVECQANRKSTWWIKVRQHKDGRAIVYAGYSYDTNWQGARSLEHKHGDYLAHTGAKYEEICGEDGIGRTHGRRRGAMGPARSRVHRRPARRRH